MIGYSTTAQPSMLNLAREGNFRAIAYLINSYLAPQGIYARVQPVNGGCLPIRLEFQTLPDRQDLYVQLRESLIKFICHHIWRLNSEAIDGVRIVATWANPLAREQPNILWNQSIRIVTPANQQRRLKYLKYLQAGVKKAAEWLNFKLLRVCLLAGGVAVASFAIGFALSYADLRHKALDHSSSSGDRAANESGRPMTVSAALETIPVTRHDAVLDPTDPTVTLMFGGDVTLSDGFEDLIGNDYAWGFDQMPEYRDADVAMVNLEGTLTKADTIRPKAFNFKSDPAMVEVLEHGGVDLVNLANNHAMDYNGPGLQETLETLAGAGIHAVGAGMNLTEARRPKIVEVKGQRIAYFGYYTGDFHAAVGETPGTNRGLKERIAEDLQAVRDEVEWIVVNFHWGVELANYPDVWQTQLARYTIDRGADAIVGHHPHVLQGAEIYKDRPIAYSLGNFIFGGNARSDYDTAVLKIALREGQMKVEFLPVEVQKYQPRVVTGERGDRILQQIEMLSGSFEQPMVSPMILEGRHGTTTAAASPVQESAAPKSEEEVAGEAPGDRTASLEENPPSEAGRAEGESFDVSPFTAASEAEELTAAGDRPSDREAAGASGRGSQAGLVVATALAVGALGVTTTAIRQKKIEPPAFAKTNGRS
ncbi:MAG: CapA family protein [Cyanobacteria bacterium J007]|jgi:hypothetical protein|nr:MAG: CapA family protein [Cyanobacteria bacterium J007]